jgi:hypothetical protein
MENKATLLEQLFEKAEVYSKTSIELYTHTTVYKSADVLSSLAVKITIAIILAIFVLLASIGFALWIGDVLGKNYYGFFIVAIAYLLFGLFLYVFKKQWIKTSVSNFIILKMLKKN